MDRCLATERRKNAAHGASRGWQIENGTSPGGTKEKTYASEIEGEICSLECCHSDRREESAFSCGAGADAPAPDVIAKFKKPGKGYQTRANRILPECMFKEMWRA